MKHSKIISILVLIVSLFLIIPNFSFAQTDNQSLRETAENLTIITKVMSWLRIPIANLAGKMMSNSLVTGEAFKITGFLFQARSICRVIANFLIVGVVLHMVYTIASSGKGSGASELGGKIIRIVFTSVLVNSSWFLLSAVIDMSNLAVLGVSNVGLQMIQSSPMLQGAIARQMYCMPQKSTFAFGNKTDVNTTPNCISTNGAAPNEYTQKIIPTREDMSGPFMYFGMGVFKTYEYLDINTTNSSNSTNGTYDVGSITISFLLKIFLMIMFMTPLIAILIVNFVRMLLIWLWFATGPLIALKLGGLDKDASWLSNILSIGNFKPMFEGGYGGGEDHFDAKNIIGAIFTPVTVVGTLFFAIIAIASIFSGLSSGPADTNANLGRIAAGSQAIQDKVTNGFEISVDGHSISAGGSSFQMEGNFIKDTSQYIGGALGYLIICLMTIGLMRAVFRIGLSTSKLLSKLGNKVMDKGKAFITEKLQLPIGVGGKPVSLSALDKNTFNLDKFGGYYKDNYIDPVKTDNLRKLKRVVENSKWGHTLGFEKTYDGSIRFDTQDTKFDKNTFDKKVNVQYNNDLTKFSNYSEQFFRNLRTDINDVEKAGGIVKPDNYRFQSAIRGRLSNGGAEYLEHKKVIEKKDYIDTDSEGKEQVNIDKLFTSGNKLGGFVERILSPDVQKKLTGTGPGDTKFNELIGDIVSGDKMKADKQKEYTKIKIKPIK